MSPRSNMSVKTKTQYYKLSYESDPNITPKTSTPSSPKHPPSSKQESINRRLDLLITNNNLNVPETLHNDVISPIEEFAPPLPPRSYKQPSPPTSPQHLTNGSLSHSANVTSPKRLTNGSLSHSANVNSLQKQFSNELENEDLLGRENLAQVNRQIYESLGQMSPTSK